MHDLNAIRSSQADALRPVANRQSGDLSLETPLESFDDSEQLRQQAFNYRRYQPTPATTAGSASPQGGLLTLDRRIYRYDAASASPLIHEQSVLRYQNTVSARVKIDPLFGKPQAFTDEVLDTGTCVIELDGINEGVADKRTLRAIIMDNPQATGKILVLEADPLIFYGAPITDANSLQNGQLLQFTRYSDNTDGGSAVIDGYLSARKAYFPADTSLLPTRAAGILELPQTRFNRYLPFPARDMQPLELDGETFYAWKKPNIMGHYELYRINPTQPTQLTSANQFAVLEEGEWQRLGLKGGMPTAKKTIAELAAAKKQREAEQAVEEEQLEAKHQEYVKKQPQMLLKINKAKELYQSNPAGFYQAFEKTIQERIYFFQEFFEITKKLRITTTSAEYNEMASTIINRIVEAQRKLKELYHGALEKEWAPFLASEQNPQHVDKIVKNSIGISDKRIELQLDEEKYLDELKILGRQGREDLDKLREGAGDSSTVMKINQMPMLSKWIIKPEHISEIGVTDLLEDLNSQSDAIETTICTHIDAMNDEEQLFSSARRKEVLQSVIEQYEKIEMNYQSVFAVSPYIHTEHLERLLERIREAKTSAKEALRNIIDQDTPLLRNNIGKPR
ncbi:hypothetical protein REG_1178 [Candidatus Regiella insecticola LSR1]|uniref:Uncharacterized protein n=1 Tax=Candidatus Regiella insecticola LSR1 TaxID=663321 RepID=E0WT34_9ENTR|nr:hypothetical protein [Candidatus Regiella insecticola]EFL91719.1 hypothetical protein REG_1178 [Candidatus Regiella insecticola LSR1]